MSSPRLLWQVGAYGLDQRNAPIVEEPLPDHDWLPFLRGVDDQRLAGLLHRAVLDGRFAVTDSQAEQIEELHLLWCGRVLRLERQLLAVSDELDSAGIESVVLKGTAVAHLVFPDPALRLFADVDLLVRSEVFEQAVELLSAMGYQRAAGEPRPGFDSRFGKGASFRGTQGDELDVHRTLVFGSFGFLIDLDELFRTVEFFHLGGQRLRALGPEARLLHACYHAALGDPQPRCSSVRDIAQMLVTGTHAETKVIDLIRRWEAGAVVARAIRLCRDHLGVEVSGRLVDAVEDYRPSPRERRAIASYVGRNRSFTAKVLASLPYLHGPADKAAFLRAAIAPEPEFVASHGGHSSADWIRRGFHSLVRGRRR